MTRSSTQLFTGEIKQMLIEVLLKRTSSFRVDHQITMQTIEIRPRSRCKPMAVQISFKWAVSLNKKSLGISTLRTQC